MANEITILDAPGDEVNVLFLFPIASPKQVKGGNVVPTPSSTLPPLGALVLSQAEKDALDAGTLAFRTGSFRRDATLTAAQQGVAIKPKYSAQLAQFQKDYQDTYRFVGTRIDVP